MIVQIQTFGQVRTITKEAMVNLNVHENVSVKQALNIFVKQFGHEMEKILYSEGKLRTFYFIQIDRKNVEHEELDEVKLKANQVISIIPFIAGG